MLKNYLIHKRNTSETIKVEPRPKSLNQNSRKSKKKINNKSNANTLSLIQKSSRKTSSKQTVVENINQLDQSTNSVQSPFFAFGQRVISQKNWNLLDVDKITEVQDSNSRREINSHRSARNPYTNEKQNYNISNFEQGLRKSTKSKSNKQKSKQKSNRSRNDKTKSTIELSRVKNKDLEGRTEKMQRSVKMLWQCMGELWQNTRVSQYKSEKNNESITTLKRKLEEHEQKILEIKCDISKNLKYSEKTQTGIRG